MKKVIFLIAMALCIGAQAQQTSKTTTKHKIKKTAHIRKTTSLKKYHSKNGVIKAHEMKQEEVIEANQKKEINAPHVNSNYNETVPGLSPSNGGK